jgi:hypothetical protein
MRDRNEPLVDVMLYSLRERQAKDYAIIIRDTMNDMTTLQLRFDLPRGRPGCHKIITSLERCHVYICR